MVEEIRDGFMENLVLTTGSLNSKIGRRGQWRDERTMFNSSDPMDCSLPGSSIHGIFQARVLEWGVIAFSDKVMS